MIKYEFMRAHGKGSEGSEKGGGCEKKRGVHAPRAPPLSTLVVMILSQRDDNSY